MNWLIKDHVYELNFVENSLVQVLLSKFSIQNLGISTKLEIEFDDKTPAIRRRESKLIIKRAISNFDTKSINYQKKLDELLIKRCETEWSFDDPEFVFRYGSGGTLPIIELDNKLYYCLFYRDVDPIGWNIANGGTDSFEELINPLNSIIRELNEELIIFDVKKQIDYQFSYNKCPPINHYEFKFAREKWRSFFISDEFTNFNKELVPLKWQNGPDILIIKFKDQEPKNMSGCYININALDFGIELDKIVHIYINNNVVLLDGEINNNFLLNRPIGLFNIDRFNQIILEDLNAEFLPDIIFYSGSQQLKTDIEKNIHTFVNKLNENNIREMEQKNEWEKEKFKYKLCPVTNRIIRRNLTTEYKLFKYDVAFSFAGEEREYVEQVANILRDNEISLFYDKFETVDLWGKNLIDHLTDIYSKKSKFIIIFISIHYKNKAWTNLERQSALEKVFHENQESVLPVRFDDTELPGIHSTIGYIDLRKTSPIELSKIIMEKIKKS